MRFSRMKKHENNMIMHWLTLNRFVAFVWLLYVTMLIQFLHSIFVYGVFTGVLQHCKVLPSILWTTNGLFFAFWYRWCLFLNLNLQNCLPDMYNDYLLIGSKGRFCWTSYYSIWFSILESMDSLFTAYKIKLRALERNAGAKTRKRDWKQKNRENVDSELSKDPPEI